MRFKIPWKEESDLQIGIIVTLCGFLVPVVGPIFF